MPELVIDDRKIKVAPGTKVIEAAAQLGIMIPRFCYHPALGSVGACRVCAVKFLQGPVERGADELHDRGPGRHGGVHHRQRGAGISQTCH